MEMNSRPRFPHTPYFDQIQVSVANTNRDGTGTLVTLVDNSVLLYENLRVDRIRAVAEATTTAGLIRLYMEDGSANIWLFDELTIDPLTPSDTAKGFEGEFDYSALLQYHLKIPSGWKLKAAPTMAEVFTIFTMGYQY